MLPLLIRTLADEDEDWTYYHSLLLVFHLVAAAGFLLYEI